MPKQAIAMSPSLIDAALAPKLLKEAGFRPVGQPRHLEWGPPRKNPKIARKRSAGVPGAAPLSGIFMVGLNSGYGPKERFDADAVVAEAVKFLPAGGSGVLQYGWYKGEPEKSLRITIENSGESGAPLSDEAFVAKFTEMVTHLAERFRQQEVWYDFTRGAERVGEPMTIADAP